VVELYATTEGDAILVNVSGAKPGAKGRPLPGSADVRLAAYDPAARTMTTDEAGFRVACEPGQVGLLLAHSRAGAGSSTRTMRGVVGPGAQWVPTGALFRQDVDGDYWLVGNLRTVIETAHGPVYPQPICDALGTLPQVDLAVAYGAVVDDRTVAVAAVTVRPGIELGPVDLIAALAAIPPDERPDLVRVVDEIPVTAWHRPVAERLPAIDLQASGVWRYDAANGLYVAPATPA
jgi:putative long chain acyl-CoA synthase